MGTSKKTNSRNPFQLLLRIPVPWVFVLMYVIGVGLEYALPLHLRAGNVRLPGVSLAGGALFGIGAIIAGWGLLIFRRARTTTVPGKPPGTRDAMSSDAASAEPRKRRWKPWVIGLACMVAAATIALLASASKAEPVKMWFLRATNELGERKLVFEGTNPIPRGAELFAGVRTGSVHHAKTIADLNPFYDGTVVTAPARTNFYSTLKVPATNVPYYVVWAARAFPPPTTGSGRLRWRCASFLATHHMRGLAHLLAPPPAIHYIPSSEIE